MGNLKKQLEEEEKAKLRSQLSKENMELYKKWNLRSKIQFATRGYRFKNNPDEPVVILSKTQLPTPAGRDRCVRVTTALEYLPKNFILIFSKWRITKTKSTGIQGCYQIKLRGGHYLQTRTTLYPKSRPEYGLADYINAALPKKSRLAVDSTQNMKVSQCKLTYAHWRLGDELRKKFPIYVRSSNCIPSGDELLLPSGYGGGHKIVL